ncbi:MAG: ShlB/FhaC/HecB family hemolysin secretion/activation protein [Xenococcaceae cyanobacterium MO_188.B32]|nr:ShlB/FhaC/HecB family hemolysin secretion/activation protein [Xenococcaceae cyanobacterium MO_188.B32]
MALFLTCFCMISSSAVAQIIPNKTTAQRFNPDKRETIPPQDITPPNPIPPFPPTLPSSPAQPEELLPPPITPEQLPDKTIEETITVTEFIFTGNTAFSQAELAPATANLRDRPLPLSRLLQIAVDVAQIYADRGYVTSGAVVSIPQATRQKQQGIVEIQIIEGELEEVQIFSAPGSSSRLNRNYIRDRLKLASSKPLNLNRLQKALQLLQINPLIDNVSATLAASSTPGGSILEVTVTEADTFTSEIVLANDRTPSVGSFRRGVGITEANLFGLGDEIRLAYNNTDGKDEIDVAYQIPWNPRNGTIGFTYNHSANEIIEPPFDDFDIKSNSNTFELTLRQPVIQTIEQQNYHDFVLGLTSSLRDSESSVSNMPFPLSPGANEKGETHVFALRFFQEYTQRNPRSVFALRSQFNFGLDALDSTVNEQIEGVDRIPDSRFFAWRFQGQYVRLLGRNSLFLVRTNGQIADQRLLSSEQFSLGGLGSVRGYRQDRLLTDNGIFLSAEVQLPIFRVFKDTGVVQLIPFIDYGTTWNSSGIDNPDERTLSSLGLGLQWRQGSNFNARLDWGIPLVDVDSRERTWQENGIHFTMRWVLF